jgi:hypothetical protein
MPGEFLQQAIAAANIMLNSYFPNLKNDRKMRYCVHVLSSGVECACAKKINAFYFFGVMYQVDVFISSCMICFSSLK